MSFLLKMFPLSLYLKLIGIKHGNNCRFNRKVNFGSEPYLIEFGDNFYCSSNIQFITHDGGVNVVRNIYHEYSNVDMIKTIKIKNNVFIGYGCTVLPGSKVNDNVIIGANSLVKGELASNSVYAGVPAKRICSIDEFVEKNRDSFLKTKSMSAKEKKKLLINLTNNFSH